MGGWGGAEKKGVGEAGGGFGGWVGRGETAATIASISLSFVARGKNCSAITAWYHAMTWLQRPQSGVATLGIMPWTLL